MQRSDESFKRHHRVKRHPELGCGRLGDNLMGLQRNERVYLQNDKISAINPNWRLGKFIRLHNAGKQANENTGTRWYPSAQVHLREEK